MTKNMAHELDYRCVVCFPSGRRGLIANVNPDGTVNLAVLLPNGALEAHQNVRLLKPDDPTESHSEYCRLYTLRDLVCEDDSETSEVAAAARRGFYGEGYDRLMTNDQ